jgi:hypothetical protein
LFNIKDSAHVRVTNVVSWPPKMRLYNIKIAW